LVSISSKSNLESELSVIAITVLDTLPIERPSCSLLATFTNGSLYLSLNLLYLFTVSSDASSLIMISFALPVRIAFSHTVLPETSFLAFWHIPNKE
jgi:hypothetical protein